MSDLCSSSQIGHRCLQHMSESYICHQITHPNVDQPSTVMRMNTFDDARLVNLLGAVATGSDGSGRSRHAQKPRSCLARDPRR